MRVFLSLCSILVKAFYGINRVGKIRSAKQVFKAIGIVLLILYGVGAVGAMFVLINLQTYNAYAPINLQNMIILNNVIMILIVTFVFSLITTMSVYFLSNAEISFQALPLKPWQIFSSKMLVVYISEAVISLLIMLPLIVIFGIKEHPGVLFYVYGILGSLLLPVIPICLTFIILVPILRVFKFMRRKNILLIIAGFIGIAFMIMFQVYYQKALGQITDPGQMLSMSWQRNAASIFPPAMLFEKALSAYAGLEGFAYMTAIIGISISAVALCIILLSRMYSTSLIGFNEQALRKLADADSYISRSFKRRNLLSSLFRREWNLMNREPAFFFNGPFIILLMPLMFVILYFAVFKERFEDVNMIALVESMVDTPLAVLIAAAVGGFLGTATMITGTSWSRDAKFLPQIKSLPVSPGLYGFAKLIHGLVFGAIGILVGTLPVIIFLRLSILKTLLTLGLSGAYVWLINIAGLYLDTAVPKLKWDSPIAAFKQNPNALAVIFGTMGIITLLGVAVYFLEINIYGYLLILCLPMAAVSALLTWRYPGFAAKRLNILEV